MEVDKVKTKIKRIFGKSAELVVVLFLWLFSKVCSWLDRDCNKIRKAWLGILIRLSWARKDLRYFFRGFQIWFYQKIGKIWRDMNDRERNATVFALTIFFLSFLCFFGWIYKQIFTLSQPPSPIEFLSVLSALVMSAPLAGCVYETMKERQKLEGALGIKEEGEEILHEKQSRYANFFFEVERTFDQEKTEETMECVLVQSN